MNDLDETAAVASEAATMKYHSDFEPSGESFAERIGTPDAFDAAIGRIVLGFRFLEDTARNIIILLPARNQPADASWLRDFPFDNGWI